MGVSEEREKQWQQHFREFPEKMHREIARVVGEGVASVVRDIETADKIARAVAAGFARLRAIDAAAEAERDPDGLLS